MGQIRRGTYVAICILTVALLGGFAYALTHSRQQSRHDLEGRLGERATIAAALIESTMRLTTQSQAQQLQQLFGDGDMGRAEMQRALNGMPGASIEIADDRGRVIASLGPAASPPGTVIASAPAVRTALAGGTPGADVVRSSNGATTAAIVMTISTRSGRRVVRTFYPGPMLQAFLTGYLTRIASNPDDQAFVVDRNGLPVGASGTIDPKEYTTATKATGHLDVGGTRRYYAGAPIAGMNWRVVVAVPEDKLLAPISGASAWLPWILFAGFALMAGAALSLLIRLSRGSAHLQRANAALEQRNEEVLQADRMKSDFLATMSHELRTPLNGIIGFAELMHDGRVGPVAPEHKEYLRDILSSSNHLRRLIDDVLDLSKIEAGKMELHPESVDVGIVVAEVCDVMASLAVRKRIYLQSEIDPLVGVVDVDSAKLKQVLFNYVSNAVKFTPEGGNVTVGVLPEDDDHYRVIVTDDGPGISPENLGRLWGAFEQLDTGSSRRYGGTGLGLSLTKRIVEAQGGSVGVESTPGVGSCFWAVLPRKLTVGESAAAPVLSEQRS